MLKNFTLLPALVLAVGIVGLIGILLIAAAYSEAHTVTWSRGPEMARETLRLSEKGTYTAEMSLDIGPNGMSRGYWQESNGVVTLRSEHNQLRTLMHREIAGEQVLVPSEDLALFEEHQFGPALVFRVQAKEAAR